MLIILLCVGVLLLAFFCSKQIAKYDSINKLPGPHWKELLQFALKNKSGEEIYHSFLELHEKFGPVVKIWAKPLRPMVMIADFQIAQKILMSNQYISKTPLYDLFKHYFGDALVITKNDDTWRKDRKSFNYSFDTKTLEEYTNVDRRHIEELFGKIKQNEDQPIELQTLLSDCVLDVMLDCLTKEQVDSGDKREYQEARHVFFELFSERAYSSWKRYDFLYRFCPDYKAWVMSSKILKKIPKQILEKHITDIDSSDTTKFMNVLMNSGMSYEKMHGNLGLFLGAGHDTTAQTVSFILYSIAQTPAIQQSIYEESVSILGKEKIADITLKDTEKMKYLECVIKESLRRYSITTIIQRRLNTDFIMDDIKLPAGIDVTISIAAIQRSSKYYENPMDFNPDRFMDGTDNYAYLPFSLGPRNCIGAKLAMIVMKILISHIVRNFELNPVKPKHNLKIAGEWVLNSVNGMPIMMKQRQECE